MKKIASWMIVAAILMGAIQIAVSYVKNNNRFNVIFFQAHDRGAYYESEPASVRVEASPAIKWREASGLAKTAGRIFWLLIGVACFFVGTDRHLPGTKGGAEQDRRSFMARGIAMIMAPVVLSVIILFSGYSASLDQKSLVKPFDDFKNEFQISQEAIEKITTKGGAGVRIKDDNGLLTQYFLK